MFAFYKKVLFVSLCLVLTTLLFALVCASGFYKQESLLPLAESLFPWKVETIRDNASANGSSISVLNQTHNIDFVYTLNEGLEYPYVRLLLAFGEAGGRRLVSLSSFNKVSFNVRCSQRSVLTFNLRTFDPNVTRPEKIESYRISSHWFECFESRSTIEVDLRRMEVPAWWLAGNGISLHDRSYLLEKVVAFSLDSSRSGPLGEEVGVQISELKLHSYRWGYLVFFGAFFCVIWGTFIFWFFKQHSQCLVDDIQRKMLNDRPLMAYRRLSLKSHIDREKRAVLEYMAKEYANPDLNLELLMKDLGVNRKKVNEILREELGFTFRAYLNKLRLTEAARLVCGNQDLNINEIAFSVGYRNVTHFNKVFKDEYGCSPGMFKKLQAGQASEERS